MKKATPPSTQAAHDPPKDYDVCLSFANEDRAYVERVAKALEKAGLRVFYDTYAQAELWGRDLYTHLDGVYRLRARFCVMFVSKHYAGKLWTNHERRSAQARAFLENDEYILPVRLDDTALPGLLPTVGFLRACEFSPPEIARCVAGKISTARQNARVARTANSEFRRVLYEGFDYRGMSASSIKAAIAGRWLVGKRGKWLGRIADGRYELSNHSALTATLNNRLTFTDGSGREANLAEGMVSVRVRLQPPLTEHSAGGLLFRVDEGGGSYFAFYRCPGRGLALCRVAHGKLERVWTEQLLELDDDEFVRLSICGQRDRMELRVDASTVLTYDVGTIQGRSVGISAMGTGRFAFDDFALYVRNR